jgi:hypothetical protein
MVIDLEKLKRLSTDGPSNDEEYTELCDLAHHAAMELTLRREQAKMLAEVIRLLPSEEPTDYGNTGNSDDARKYGASFEAWVIRKDLAEIDALETRIQPATPQIKG